MLGHKHHLSTWQMRPLTVKNKARTQSLLPLPQLALLAALLSELVLLSSVVDGPARPCQFLNLMHIAAGRHAHPVNGLARRQQTQALV